MWAPWTYSRYKFVTKQNNEIHNFNWNQNQIFTLILLSLGSDHQTFSMSLPTRLRDYYDKVVTPAADSGIHETFHDIYIELKYELLKTHILN